jgi:hypothetical protein
MKKVLLLSTLLLFLCTGIMNAQETRKERREARREAAKKKIEAERALEARQDSIAFEKAMAAMKAGSFVLEADNIMFPNGITRYVTASTNYVQVNEGEGIVQTAFSNFAYSPGPNGLGGVTVQGTVSDPQIQTDKHGNVFYNFSISGIAISATISITLTGGTNEASAYISPNFNSNNITMTGHIVPYEESVVFQGMTW